MIEIELKAWIDEPEELAKVLSKQASFIKEDFKEDNYYFHSSIKSINFDTANFLRLRKTKDKWFLATKNQKKENGIEVNQEFEFEVERSLEVEKLIDLQGYQLFITKSKATRVFYKEGITIEINIIEGLGNFIELEIIADSDDQKEKHKERLLNFLKSLGISESEIEHRYYIEMLNLKRKQPDLVLR